MRLRYYAEEKKAFPKAHRTHVSPAHAAFLTQELLKRIGEPPATIVLHKEVRNYDRACKSTRTIEYAQPSVTLAAIIHEVAHLWHERHDNEHATAVCLLTEVLRRP